MSNVKNELNGDGWTVSDPSENNTTTITCTNWNGFINCLHDERVLKQNDAYCFRGQADENWKLEPALKRNVNTNITDEKQTEILKVFKKYCLGRRGHNPPGLSKDEWWSLGQHYGLKTPLLDWTESPYVAAFFAFKDVENGANGNVVNTTPNPPLFAADYKN